MTEPLQIPRGLTREDFREWYRQIYLRSPHWIRLRAQALDWWEHSCGQCGARKHLDVHHLSHRRLGREEREDLAVLCRTCHKRWHRHKKSPPLKPKDASRGVDFFDDNAADPPDDAQYWWELQTAEWRDNLY